MATVLNLIQSACYALGITPATAYATSTDPADLQILNLLYEEARHLRNQRTFPQIKKIKSLTTTTASTYQLPEDFFAAIGDTGWNRTSRQGLGAPGSDVTYNQLTYGSSVSGSPYNYRIFGPDSNTASAGGQFNVYPAPSSGTVLSFEYITKTMFLPPFWVASETGITVGKYRFVNGNIYKATAVTTGTTSTTAPSHVTSTAIDGGVTWTYISAPYETILTDSDVCLFDDDIMIVGLKWRWKAAKDQDFSTLLAEHNALKDKAKTRWTGSFRGSVNNYGYNLFSGRARTQNGSWVL